MTAILHDWLDSWSGLGLIIAGMTHQGWDVQLTAYAARDRRANYYPVGIAHSIVGGSACEPTPWARCSEARGAPGYRTTQAEDQAGGRRVLIAASR